MVLLLAFIRVTDDAMTLGFLGIRSYAMVAESGLGGWGDLVGALYLLLALPAGIAFGLDLIPFAIER